MFNKKLQKMILSSLVVSTAIIFTPVIYSFDYDDNCPIILSVAHAEIKTFTESGRAMYSFGENDPDLKFFSKKTIPIYMPKAEVVIRKGYNHCAYMAAHKEEYVKEIEQFMEV